MRQLHQEQKTSVITAPSPTRGRAVGMRVAAILLTLVVCLFCGFMYLFFESSRPAAYALMPPLYPGSTLTGQWRSGGTDSEWDRRTYTTTATASSLIEYYRQHFPAATYAVQGTLNSFSNCDKSPLARTVANESVK
jgi:hypothetical protein